MAAILQDILGLLTFSHLLLQTSYEPGFVIEKKGKTSVKNGLLKCGVKQEKGQHFFSNLPVRKVGGMDLL